MTTKASRFTAKSNFLSRRICTIRIKLESSTTRRNNLWKISLKITKPREGKSRLRDSSRRKYFNETPPFPLTLAQRVERIKSNLQKFSQNTIEIGLDLIEAKKEIPHGGFAEWLNKEFNLSQRAANNFMRIAVRFGKMENVYQFQPSTLIKMLLLPEGDEQAFIEAQAEAGNPIENQSARQVQENVKQWNQKDAEKNNSTDESNHTEISPPEAHDGDFEPEPMVDLPPAENAPDKPKLPPVALNNNGKNNEYYTPQKYVDAARDVLGSIDLDPASCDLANQTVKAANYFTAETDGLNQNWQGNIFMNPPFATGLIEKFVDKLLVELESGNVVSAIVLVDNATETKWFCNLASRADSICFTNHRINFMQSNGQIEKGSPTRGQAFLLFNGDRDKFVDVFSQFGWCCLPAKKEVC